MAFKVTVNVPSDASVKRALREMRRQLSDVDRMWRDWQLGPLGGGSKLFDVYTAAENAQHAAFELKELLLPIINELSDKD